MPDEVVDQEWWDTHPDEYREAIEGHDRGQHLPGAADIRLTVTVEEAAQLIGISRSALYDLIRQDEFPHIRLGRRIVVPRQGLEDLLAGRWKSVRQT